MYIETVLLLYLSVLLLYLIKINIYNIYIILNNWKCKFHSCCLLNQEIGYVRPTRYKNDRSLARI